MIMKKQSIKTLEITREKGRIVYKFDENNISPRKAKKLSDDLTKRLKRRRKDR